MKFTNIKMQISSIKILIWISILMIVTFIVLYIISFNSGLSDENSDWGNFGSYSAGTIGICFSLLSVIFLYLTFREQRTQKFENMFLQYVTHYYNLLNLIRENFLHKNPAEYLIGREIFGRAIQKIDTKDIEESFNKIYNTHINVFQHYCNYITELILFVSNNKDLDNKDQLNYINRFLSMLSTFELVFISYYVWFNSDNKNLILIKKYLSQRLSEIPTDGNTLVSNTNQIKEIQNLFKNS